MRVATHPDYLMSAVAGKRFVKVKYVPNVVQLLTSPNLKTILGAVRKHCMI